MATINACSRGENTLKVARCNERLPMFIINSMSYPICVVDRDKSKWTNKCSRFIPPKIGSSVDHWVYLKLGGIIEGLNSYLLP